MAVGTEIHQRSFARGVTVELEHTVVAEQLAYVQGFVGITVDAGVDGDYIALDIERQVIEIEVPSAVWSSATVGSVVYLDLSQVTGHSFNNAAYTLTAGSNKPFLKVVEKIAGNVLAGIMLSLEI